MLATIDCFDCYCNKPASNKDNKQKLCLHSVEPEMRTVLISIFTLFVVVVVD